MLIRKYHTELILAMVALLLSGCGQRFAGSSYHADFGRQVTQMFDDNAVTLWRVGAEVRFDAVRK